MEIDRDSGGAEPPSFIRRSVREFEAAPVFAAREVGDRMWTMIRAFALRLEGSDVRLRFGVQPDLRDEPTLRRFFGPAHGAEMLWMLDGSRGIAAIAHRVRLSPLNDEIALLVRSDLKRRGAGTRLLREMVARSCADGQSRVSALVLSENRPMIRIARKEGFAAAAIEGLNVWLELELHRRHAARAAMVPKRDSAMIVST